LIVYLVATQTEVRGKGSLCIIKLYDIKTYGEVEIYLDELSTSILVENKLLASRFGPLTPGESAPV
jgi:hypothetical protein